MGTSYIEQLLKKLENNYYLDILISIEAAIAFIILLTRWNSKTRTITFTLYTFSLIYLFSFGSDINLSILFKNDYSLKKSILEYGNTVFAFVEMIAFYFHFRAFLKNSLKARIINYIFMSFLIYYFIQITPLIFESPSYQLISNKAANISIFEILCLFILCLIYYINIIDKKMINSPVDKFGLYLTNALFYYTSVSLPFISIMSEIKTTYSNIYKLLVLLHYSSVFFILATFIYVLKKQKINTI